VTIIGAYKRDRSVVSSLHVHSVFVTTNRHGVLHPEHLDLPDDIFAKVCSDSGATLVECNGEADHVHLLVQYPPTVAISSLVISLKGVSSHRLRQRYEIRTHRDHPWSPSNFAASAGGAPLSTIQQSVRAQRQPAEPHRLTRAWPPPGRRPPAHCSPLRPARKEPLQRRVLPAGSSGYRPVLMVQRGRVTVTWAEVERAEPLEFAYLEDGPADGPLALCLHGFPDHAPTWTALLEDLAAAGFHAVAPWMRGYAPTAVPADGLYQPAALSLDAIALADALAPGDRTAILVGHDWGAVGAYGAVVHRPDRFARLVAMSVPHRASLTHRMVTSPAQLKRSWYMFFFQMPLAEFAVRANDFALIDRLWRDWSPSYEPPPEHLRAVKDTLATAGVLDAAIGYYRHLLNPLKHDGRLAAVEAAGTGVVPVPTLYLHGADDGCFGADMVDPDDMKPFFAAGLEAEIMPGVGHFLHLEDPAKVNGRIVEFLTAGS
jgi:pimeloyl-ACP methyl ester carboxylesterase/REP element-mobilizing transposase RayT